jgi:hypothetical protein
MRRHIRLVPQRTVAVRARRLRVEKDPTIGGEQHGAGVWLTDRIEQNIADIVMRTGRTRKWAIPAGAGPGRAEVEAAWSGKVGPNEVIINPLRGDLSGTPDGANLSLIHHPFPGELTQAR